MRKLTEKKLLLASRSQDKLKELQGILAPYSIEVLTPKDLNLTLPENNDGETFLESAKAKALTAAKLADIPVLADESGLCVHSLGNWPGLEKGPHPNFKDNMKKIMEDIKDKPDKSAHYHCALAIVWPDGESESFEAETHGTILTQPQGDADFGYDAIFVPYGFSFSFAQMAADKKALLSHRGKALKMFLDNIVM